MESFGDFLEAAIYGKEIQVDFDEKQSSKLKSLLLKFLTARQIREERIQEEKEKTRSLISDISHQTKTPISNLNLYLHLMKENSKEEYLEIMEYEVKKLQFLVEDLVQSSRMESGMIQIQKGNYKVKDLWEKSLQEIKLALEEKNLRLNLHVLEDFSLNLDPKWMGEVFHNLLDNAIKYCPEGGVINISLEKTYINYRITIENDSVALKEEEKAKIFQRFYRGSNSRGQDGLGLGLFISREIVNRHGGKIYVNIQDNKTCFILDFPI